MAIKRTPSTAATVATMNEQISAETYSAIESLIASDASPVGIDAKKTHIIIIDQLRRIEERLARVEACVGGEHGTGTHDGA